MTIEIGGVLAECDRARFANLIADHCISIEWSGPTVDLSQLPMDAPLKLNAHEVAWGRLDARVGFCVARGLPFRRWSGGNGGDWLA